jgi:hypothetical protein
MFRCVGCPGAFCAECNGEAPFDAVEANPEWEDMGRGLHSPTFQLSLSRF